MKQRFFFIINKFKFRLEEYRRESVKATASLSKLIATIGRITYNESAAGQIKRMAQQAIDIRELCQQHSMQVDQLESWLGSNGIELCSPPPAPRRPPVKKARLMDSIESIPTVEDWCRQVKAEELKVNLECKSCTVMVPNSLTRLLKTISKKTRRDIAEVCNNFQYVVGDENQENMVESGEAHNVKTVGKGEPRDEEQEESVQSSLSQQFRTASENTDGENSCCHESKEHSDTLDLTSRSPRKCAAKFDVQVKLKKEGEIEVPTPMDDIFEFRYDENDEGDLMRRVTFRICDYVDAVARRVFLDPWIPYGYSGEEQITKVVKANLEGAVREVNRRYVAQPWRQFKGTPFHYTQEVDVTYILPSGKLLVVPLGYIKSQTKSTSFGRDFMLKNSVRVRLSRSSGEGIILINGEQVACSLIKSGPIRPDDHEWQPRLPPRPGQTSVMSFAQQRLENLRTNWAEKAQKEE